MKTTTMKPKTAKAMTDLERIKDEVANELGGYEDWDWDHIFKTQPEVVSLGKFWFIVCQRYADLCVQREREKLFTEEDIRIAMQDAVGQSIAEKNRGYYSDRIIDSIRESKQFTTPPETTNH